MFGAVNDGATVFLAPAGNCNDVRGYVPEGLTVIPVVNLADAVESLALAAAGAPTPVCPGT
jgi:PDZ domain-containing protein